MIKQYLLSQNYSTKGCTIPLLIKWFALDAHVILVCYSRKLDVDKRIQLPTVMQWIYWWRMIRALAKIRTFIRFRRDKTWNDSQLRVWKPGGLYILCTMVSAWCGHYHTFMLELIINTHQLVLWQTTRPLYTEWRYMPREHWYPAVHGKYLIKFGWLWFSRHNQDFKFYSYFDAKQWAAMFKIQRTWRHFCWWSLWWWWFEMHGIVVEW